MSREEIIRLAEEAGFQVASESWWVTESEALERFAALVAAAERAGCVHIIETYRIPVGNSSAGEMACEWTYDALYQIRDDIRARGEK